MVLPSESLHDPRVDPDHVRTVQMTSGQIVLIGVVHDHPASIHRVRSIVDSVEPETVALELPALAVPLYEAFASDDDPSRGGEMRAAIDAAGDANVVGIDAPSGRFIRALLKTYKAQDTTRLELRRVLRGLVTVSRHAVHCRLAAPLVRHTRFDTGVDRPTKHGCEFGDAPSTQAADERRQIARSVALLGALDGGNATSLRDEARERAMATALVEHAENGAVVAVVGRDHLDPVAALLSDRADDARLST